MASLKSFAKDGGKKALSFMGAYDWRHRGGVTILIYHRVLPAAQIEMSTAQAELVVSTQAFERNMRLLRERYTLLSFKEYLERLDNGAWSPDKRYAIVTLDDGSVDNYLHAFPILAKHEVPATIFVCTSHIGADLGFWWQVIGDAVLSAYRCPHDGHPFFDATRKHGLREDRTLQSVFRARRESGAVQRIDAFIEQLKSHPPRAVQRLADDCAAIMEKPIEAATMTWEQIGEMSARGVEFGSHAVHHLLLTKLPSDEAAREIADSAAVLRARPAINYVPVFCYPNGDVNDAVRELVREAGYRAAVTTNTRVAGFKPIDRYRLPRINVSRHAAASDLLFKLRLSRAQADKADPRNASDLAQA